jgi:hypothetical protein
MSSKLYFRKSDVVQALRECADKARAEGFAAGRAEAERFLEFAARLNGSAPHVLKAIRGEELPPRKESPPADEDASPLDAATLAYIDALIEAKTHHADSDGGDVADVLRGWIEDPAALEAALGGEMLLKAFDEGKHPRDDGGRFVSKEAIHAAKSDPKKAEELRARVTDPEQRKKLDAAIGGETDLGRTKRGEQQQASEGRKAEAKKRFDRVRELKDAISAARRGGEEVPHTHFTELAEHLPHLTVSQLRSVRESLAASFFGRKRRDEMVTALVRHAKVRAEQMRAEQDAGDGLDFGMDAMSPAAAGGQGRAHDSDLNPWREFDKDKGYGEAQHGGRIGQRKQIMDAVSDGAKTSHGTPDTGSELKLAPEVARPMPSEAATAMKHLPVDKSASKKYAETGQAAAFRIHNAKYPLPKKSKSTWSGDESETMPGVSGYATMGGALGDMLFNQTESATGDNYTQQVMGDEGDKPSIVVMHGKEIDGPGAETIVPNPKIAAVFTMGQVEHMASELAKSRGATGDSWEELSKSIEWEDRDAFNDALAEKMRQSNPSTIPEATSRKPKPAPQKPAAEDTELWQLPQKQYAENYYAGENFENHRRIIKEALAAGKSVPPEVLADYPDLAPKPPTAPQNPPKESEDVAPIAEPPAKKLGEKKTRKPSATDSLYDWTQHYGGIDPESHAFQTFFGSVNEARENGIPLGVFKKGGEGLDVIARQMLNSGHINAKDEVEAQQVLLDGLASKAYSYHADRTKDYDKALQNYERAKQEAADALNESSIREAERSGEAEADRGEPASGRGADQDSDAGDGGRQPGDAAEPIGEVDTSFDFGDSTPTSKSDAKNDAKASAQPSQKATPEQAAARKWQKNDDGTYTAPNGTVWRKAAAGGEVSPVTGQPFKGGHMMPVHGLSPKVEKPQTTGTGDAASVKPNEDAEGKRQPARSPMTPEQIEEERENRARQAKWDEMRGGVLGKLKHLTDKPMPLRNSTIDVDRWKQFADGVDEGKLKQIVDVLRKDRHDAIDADVVAQGQTNLDKDSIDWEKNSPERQSEIFPLSGKYRSKGKPSSNLARQHVQHALEDAKNPHDLHAIEKKLQGIVNAPAPSDTPVSPTQNAAPSAKPDASKTTSPAAIPPDHAAALRDAAKHHRRMQMPGKPIPAHVVYTKPATKDATGKPLDPEETVAIPADSSGGERILAGKSPHYTVHGVYEFGPDGTPRIAEPRQMAAQAKRIVHDDGATGV